jgi:hypothetical protein
MAFHEAVQILAVESAETSFVKGYDVWTYMGILNASPLNRGRT